MKSKIFYSEENFGLLPSQIVFVDGTDNKIINQLLSDSLEGTYKTKNGFEDKGYDLVVFSRILSDLKYSGFIEDHHGKIWSILSYFYPNQKHQFKNWYFPTLGNQYDYQRDYTQMIFSNFGYTKTVQPGFFRLKEQAGSNSDYVYEYCEFPAHFRNNIFLAKNFINRYLKYLPSLPTHTYQIDDINESPRVMYSFRKDPYQEFGVLHKIKDAIKEAKQLGIYELIIQEVYALLEHEQPFYLHEMSDVVVSRLTIDAKFDIRLPDYDNTFISMTPLPKTLFIFFLRHPEGIILKQIAEYEEELYKIYSTISGKRDFDVMRSNIKRLCNPLEESLHQKLSRIRNAFVSSISDVYASNYYVTGERGGVHRITVDRGLVEIAGELGEFLCF
jgi:hypothetical protein